MIDIYKRERKYEAKYALNNPYGVRQLLEDVHLIVQHAYGCGDIEALIIYLDLVHALQQSKLTRKQKEVIYYFFLKDLTQKEVALELGIVQQKVSARIDRALERIAVSQGYNKEEILKRECRQLASSGL